MDRIHIKRGQFGMFVIVRAPFAIDDENNSILIQMDWDYPSVASGFGFIPCEECTETDGTIDCEHKRATDMIHEARSYLDDIADTNTETDDPGYFTETEE